MSRKSSFRRKREQQEDDILSITITPKGWNLIREEAGLPLTGEPVAPEICARLAREYREHQMNEYLSPEGPDDE